jgi:hypothetical protein
VDLDPVAEPGQGAGHAGTSHRAGEDVIEGPPSKERADRDRLEPRAVSGMAICRCAAPRATTQSRRVFPSPGGQCHTTTEWMQVESATRPGNVLYPQGRSTAVAKHRSGALDGPSDYASDARETDLLAHDDVASCRLMCRSRGGGLTMVYRVLTWVAPAPIWWNWSNSSLGIR